MTRTIGPNGGDLLAQRYRLIDRVGAGGMSVVWRARDEVLDRLVAVKWLGAELADDQLFRDLVRREAWATARIKHPAVAAVYDYGEVVNGDGASLAYVVMEMLDGQSLADRLRRGPLPWREAVRIGAELADALATAHEQGVVHRDISPDNVMLTSSGVRLFDFGIAAPIGEPDDDSTGSTFGTPAYVAPERLDGSPAQTPTDVYSLGVMLFETLTGSVPFKEDTWNPEAPLTPRAAPRPKCPGLPKAVARLVQRCLAHDPAERPTAQEVADRLTAYRAPWRRAGTVLAVAAAVIVAFAAVASALVWGPFDRGPEDPNALPGGSSPSTTEAVSPASGKPTSSGAASATSTRSPAPAEPTSTHSDSTWSPSALPGPPPKAPTGPVTASYEIREIGAKSGFTVVMTLRNESTDPQAWQVRLKFADEKGELTQAWIGLGPGVKPLIWRQGPTWTFESPVDLAGKSTIILGLRFEGKTITAADPLECRVNGHDCR